MTEKWTRIEVDHPAVVEMYANDAGFPHYLSYRGKVIVGEYVVPVIGSGFMQDEHYDIETGECDPGFQFAHLEIDGNDEAVGDGSYERYWEDNADEHALYAAVIDLLDTIAGVS